MDLPTKKNRTMDNAAVNIKSYWGTCRHANQQANKEIKKKNWILDLN